jgi:hypothetical protein
MRDDFDDLADFGDEPDEPDEQEELDESGLPSGRRSPGRPGSPAG